MGKMVKPVVVLDHSFHCNYVASFDKFGILAHENKKYQFEIKESLLIMRAKTSQHRSVSFTTLNLYNR